MSYWKVWEINVLGYPRLIRASSSSTMRCVRNAFDFGRSKMVWGVHGRHLREKFDEGSWWMASVLKTCSLFCPHHWSRYHTHPKFLPFPAAHVSIRKLAQLFFLEGHVFFQVVLDKSYTWFWKWMILNYSLQICWKKLSFIERCLNCTRALWYVQILRFNEISLLILSSSCIKGWLSLWVFLIRPIPRRWRTSQVKEINHDEKIAKVIRTNVNYITSPRYRIPVISSFVILTFPPRDTTSVNPTFL